MTDQLGLPEAAEKPVIRFKGHIVEIRDDSFTIRVQDVNNPDAPEMETDIRIDEIKLDERQYIGLGARFTWKIDGVKGGAGINIEFSKDTWTANEIAEVRTESAALYAQWMEGSIDQSLEGAEKLDIEFRGNVQEVKGGRIRLRIQDVNGPGSATVETTIPIDKIRPEEIINALPGAKFIWKSSGETGRAEDGMIDIVFLIPEPWTAEDFVEIEKEKERMFAGWDEADKGEG